MRTLLTFVTLLVFTTLYGGMVIVAAMLGVKDRRGGVYDRLPSLWVDVLLRAAGVTVAVRGGEKLRLDEPRIYISNHVSWFDVLALTRALPGAKFVAKAELFRVPLFGQGIRALGMVRIERENRKSAFESYKVAADRIRQGKSVVVFPEGTRGRAYALRPFKKGPFVLAVAAGVPIVPVIVHGTMEIQPKGLLRVRSGPIDVHVLDEVPTAGLAYDDRDALMSTVRGRMAAVMRDVYGIESPAGRPLSSSQPHVHDS